MPWHPEKDRSKGFKPDPKALYYEVISENGDKLLVSIPAVVFHANTDRFRAWVHHPIYGLDEMTPTMARGVVDAKPILALTEEDVPRLVEEIASIITPTIVQSVLEAVRGSSDNSTVSADAAVCDDCGKVCGSPAGLAAHRRAAHKKSDSLEAK
jgi:hypothetical protein